MLEIGVALVPKRCESCRRNMMHWDKRNDVPRYSHLTLEAK